MPTEIFFDESALSDIQNIIDVLPQFQKNGPTYKGLQRVLAAVKTLPTRAHMYPVDDQNPNFRKCSVAGYVIQYDWITNGSPRGPIAIVKRVIPSSWNRIGEEVETLSLAL